MPKPCSVFLGLAALLPSTTLTSCSSPTSDYQAGQTRLVLTGSSTVAPLALEIAKRFESEHPGVRVDVQTGGSSRGVADARRGLANIGMASRPLKPDEEDLYAFAIARDGVCLIVHQDNPVQALTDEQVVAIYTGKVDNWSDVGGNDAPITVVNKAAGRSTLELFLDYFNLTSVDVQADVVIGDNEQGIKTVAGNPNSIGYVSIGTAEYDATVGIRIQLLPVGGVEASVENVATGSFPLSRPLNLVTRQQPTGLAKEFIEYAQSDAVHDLIREQYFVPITP
ncbi:MAG TPA: phosphate ABC transporter substrate-binding protein [Pirellulaceae bacterium]|nr:phosphate ABC transporter substrate-binding protein [Pirellulaceae bacterium]